MRSNRRLGVAMWLALGASAMGACKKNTPAAPAVTPDKAKPAMVPGPLVSLPASTIFAFDMNATTMLKLPAAQQLRTFLSTQEKVKAGIEKVKTECGFDPLDRLTALELAVLPPTAGQKKPVPAVVVHGTWTRDEAKKCLTALLAEKNEIADAPALEGMTVWSVKNKPRPPMAGMPVMPAMPTAPTPAEALAMAGDAGAMAQAMLAAADAGAALAAANEAIAQARAMAADAGAMMGERLPPPGAAGDDDDEPDTGNRRVAFADNLLVFTVDGVIADAVSVLMKKKPGAESNADLVAARSALGADPFMSFAADMKAIAKAFPEQWQGMLAKVQSNPTAAQFASVLSGLGTVSFGGRLDPSGAMHGSFVFRTGSEADAKKAFDALDGLWKMGKVMLRGRIPQLRTKAEASLSEIEAKEPAAKPQIDSIRKLLPMLEGMIDKISVKQDGTSVRIDADFSADETNGMFSAFTAGVVMGVMIRQMAPPPPPMMMVPDAGAVVAMPEDSDAGAMAEGDGGAAAESNGNSDSEESDAETNGSTE